MGKVKHGAAVEPAALKKIRNEIIKLEADLKNTAKKLIERTEDLNRKGFKDANFGSLHNVITEKKVDLEKLSKIMLCFSEYLDEVEKNIRKYTDGPAIKPSNHNIN